MLVPVFLSDSRVLPDDAIDEVPPPRGEDAEAPQVATVGLELQLQDPLQDLLGQRIHRGRLCRDEKCGVYVVVFLRTCPTRVV